MITIYILSLLIAWFPLVSFIPANNWERIVKYVIVLVPIVNTFTALYFIYYTVKAYIQHPE